MRTAPVLDIDDLDDDLELSDQELADIAGGAQTVTVTIKVTITIKQASSCAVGGGYDYD
jgi:hypothetical protein